MGFAIIGPVLQIKKQVQTGRFLAWCHTEHLQRSRLQATSLPSCVCGLICFIVCCGPCRLHCLCSWIFSDIMSYRGRVRLCWLLLVADSTHLWMECGPMQTWPLTRWVYGSEATDKHRTDSLKLIIIRKHVKISEDKRSIQCQGVQWHQLSSVCLFSENIYNLKSSGRQQYKPWGQYHFILPLKLRPICKISHLNNILFQRPFLEGSLTLIDCLRVDWRFPHPIHLFKHPESDAAETFIS